MSSTPSPLHSHPLTRLAWCLAGAIALTLYVVSPPLAPFVLASLGGSTVFLLRMTRAPAVQLRAMLGGHLGGACIGIACAQVFGASVGVCALAVALTLAWMLATCTVHPPAGANPIIMVYAHASWSTLLNLVLLGVACLLAPAIVWSCLYPGLVLDPVAPSSPRRRP
jgi:CBS-domain-containing membrane protein